MAAFSFDDDVPGVGGLASGHAADESLLPTSDTYIVPPQLPV